LFWNLFQELHLLLLGVDPERRRKGIGSQLLQRFFLEGRVSLCRRAFLELRVSNESALAFYEAQGFQVAHRLNQFYPDSEDAFQMEYAFPRKDSF
jgi:ribosomal-protein-alanine N-acetyltransferase